MTFIASAIGAVGSSSATECPAAIPPEVQPDDVITVCVIRSGESISELTLVCDNVDGTVERVHPLTGQGNGVVSSGARYAVFQRVAVAGDEASTFTASGGGGRWLVLVRVDRGVGPTIDDLVVTEPAAGGNNIVAPAAQPAAGSTGGTAVIFPLVSDNDPEDKHFSSADATIRDQLSHTSSTGQNPAGAIADRTFSTDAQVPSTEFSLTDAATSQPLFIDNRAAVTILYSGDVVQPLTADAGDDVAAIGGQEVVITGTASGGSGSYSHSWAQLSGGALALSGTATDTVRFVAPLEGGTFELAYTTDDGTSQDVDTLLVTVAARQGLGLAVSSLAAGWTTSTGATDPVLVIDELDDATTYLEAPEGTSGVPQEVLLDPLPAQVRTAGIHGFLNLELDLPATSATYTVELLEDGTVISTDSVIPTEDLQRLKVDFPAVDCANIVDLAACSVRLTSAVTA